MKAENISKQSPGGQREILADNVPLSTPYVVQFHPTSLCNFKCKYCIFSLKKESRPFISKKKFMDFNLYKKGIDGLKLFPEKIKVLKLAGLGEPLIYPQASEMIKYASEQDVSNELEIITNGFLLNRKISDDLIDSGLTRLVISIQGIDANKYISISDKKINLESLISEIKYFYENKKDTKIYIKIGDISLENEEEENKFFDMFGNICDSIAIEHIVPIQPKVVINKNLQNKKVTQFGHPINDIKICPMPFFLIHVTPDGHVIPCCGFKYPIKLGNINNESLYEIWNGKILNDFRLQMLDGFNKYAGCKGCTVNKYRMIVEDSLDEKENDIREKLKC